MNKDQKSEIVQGLSVLLTEKKNFYLADVSTMPVNTINELRRLCHQQGIQMQMVKNTLIEKALEAANIEVEGLTDVLKGSSTLMTAESYTAPAKLIKEFRKTHDKPLLKAAYIEESLYVGDDQLDALLKLKSKEVLLGEVIAMLQSPIQNVLSGLQSGGSKIAGILKTLSEKES